MAAEENELAAIFGPDGVTIKKVFCCSGELMDYCEMQG